MNINDAENCLFCFFPPFYLLSPLEKLEVAAHFANTQTGDVDNCALDQLSLCITAFTCALEADSRVEVLTAPIKARLDHLPDDHPGRSITLLIRWSFTGDLALLRELHQATTRRDARGDAARRAVELLVPHNQFFVSDLAKALAAN